MGNVNFRLDDELEERMKARAAEVPYRKPSDYLRELILADLEKVPAEKPKSVKA